MYGVLVINTTVYLSVKVILIWFIFLVQQCLDCKGTRCKSAEEAVLTALPEIS